MLKKVVLLGFAAVLGLICNGDVFAGRTWHYYGINMDGEHDYHAEHLALGMRSGKAWPVVAGSEHYQWGQMGTLTPAGWVSNGPVLGGKVRAATSTDGRVAAVGAYGNVALMTKDGVISSKVGNCEGHYANDISFNNNNDLVVAHNDSYGNLVVSSQTGSGWASSKIVYDGHMEVRSSCFAMGVDSYNQTHVAFSDSGQLGYAVKSPVSGGSWNVTETNIDIGTSCRYVDMAVNSNDIPFVVYNEDNELNCAIFNPMTARWDVSMVDFASSRYFTVAADSKGGVGIAYVSSVETNNYLSYAHYDGDGWVIDRLCEADIDKMLGLDFDYEDNPVIAFNDNCNNPMIAYDPIETPEPASLLLLGLGGFVLRKRRA